VSAELTEMIPNDSWLAIRLTGPCIVSAELTNMIQDDGWLAIKRLLRSVLHRLRYFTVNEDYVHSANPTVTLLGS